MSYPHRVKIAVSIRESIRGRQESRRAIVLDPVVLPQERLREMLLEELGRRGFREDGGGSLVRRRGEAVESVDPRTLVATSAIESEGTLHEARDVVVDSQRKDGGPEARAARAHTERTLREGGRKRFERELSARVEAAGIELERELNEAIARVCADAVREKAATLGEVSDVREERNGTELLVEIKVKVSD